MNLISNAFKFTIDGGISVHVSMKEKVCEDFKRHRFLVFQVKDTGVGIPKQDIPELFQMFRTVSKHKKKFNTKGTGLGLSISKKITEMLGGTIYIESEEGHGSVFTFDIREKDSYFYFEEQKMKEGSEKRNAMMCKYSLTHLK